MSARILKILALLFLSLSSGTGSVYACTAAVVSGKATPDGRPLLWKHRDTDALDNRLEHFRGERYSFTGLVNSSEVSAPYVNEGEREVWIGANTAGFAIMNTASYNIKDDDVPVSLMDREGVLIFKALGLCGSLSDFEHFLDTLSRPLGVQANFGVIDAHGGAAMYEVNNHSYVKYDACDPAVAPDGYIVFTNFSFSGRKEDYKGYERFLTASAIFNEAKNTGTPFAPSFIIDSLSRSFRHEFLSLDYTRDYDEMVQAGFCNGIVPDQDFIPRKSTSASVVVQGAASGVELPGAVMWTVLGYPLCSVCVPVPVSEEDHIPYYMKKSAGSDRSLLCEIATDLKERHVFRFRTSNGGDYLDLGCILAGKDSLPPMASCCRQAERQIYDNFGKLYGEYLSGSLSYGAFLERYDIVSQSFIESYTGSFRGYLLP